MEAFKPEVVEARADCLRVRAAETENFVDAWVDWLGEFLKTRNKWYGMVWILFRKFRQMHKDEVSYLFDCLRRRPWFKELS